MEKFNNSIVLIAPLDWGLGHTTRCIPIIKKLKSKKYDVIVAVNNKQQELLQQENLDIKFEHIDGYNISYANNKIIFIFKMILQIPKILCCIKKENNWLKNYTKNNKVDIVISDNRYGFYHKKIKSIFITHQLLIKTGANFSDTILQKINYYFINKFNSCWVPDIKDDNNVSGILSHPKTLPKIPINYIGLLSRFIFTKTHFQKYHACVLLSGPEPQRTLLEEKIIKQCKNTALKILLVRGLPNQKNHLINYDIDIKNHLPQTQLQQAIESSEYIICRSGYTSVMELLTLQKKMIVIPTPMQTEQEYLANHLQEKKYAVAFMQEQFDITLALQIAENFEYNTFHHTNNLENILNLV